MLAIDSDSNEGEVHLDMSRFTYNDIVMIRENASPDLRPGAQAWVIAVFPDRKSRPGTYFDRFPEGAVYTVEYEDATAADVHEDDLEKANES